MDLSRSLVRREHTPPSLVKRAADTSQESTAATTSCYNRADGNTCEKATTVPIALPIALGILLPTLALTVFYFLHRRYRKRLRMEDKADAEKYKSMDFGMDISYQTSKKGGKKGGNKGKNGSKSQNNLPYGQQHTRGLSMDPSQSTFFMGDKPPKASFDMETGSILEDRYAIVALENRAGSRGASHSVSRNNSPMPSRSRTMETHSTFDNNDNSNHDGNSLLLQNVQSTPFSKPTRAFDDDKSTFGPVRDQSSLRQPEPARIADDTAARDSYFEKNAQKMRRSGNYLGSLLTSPENSNKWEEETEKSSSPPTSQIGSTESTYTRGTKTPLTSYSDTESLPYGGIDKNAETSLNFDFDLPNSPEQSSENSGRKPLRLGMPATEDSVQPFPQSVEHKVTPSLVEPKRNSLGASVHISLVSANTSNYSDFFGPPSGSKAHPSVPEAQSHVSQHDNDASSRAPPQINAYNSNHNQNGNLQFFDNGFDFETDSNSIPPPPKINLPLRGESLSDKEASDHSYQDSNYLNHESDTQNNRLSIISRPLPPEHGEVDENPEERANRIRSFYKEYFDENSAFAGFQPPPLPSNEVNYFEDYGSEFQNSGSLYDSHQNAFVVAAPNAQFTQPVTRRAMTPPPRGPPRFDGGRKNGNQLMPPRGGSSMANFHRGRSPSNPHNFHKGSPIGSPWANSPNSSRTPSAMSSRKPLAPPKALNSLPTPHMLKNDSALFNAADFAPPISFRDMQNGRRPESPIGTQRPYSPTVKSFVPLNSSFDDLTSIPSPHSLKQNGTFSNLDFAPPTRFKNVDGGSDVSSIRSGGSSMSNKQLAHMRAGAYRLSRLPKGLAGTKQDIMHDLKPSWDMRRPA